MTRLGIWGVGQPFPEFTDFINAVEKRGVGAMEVVAMDIKVDTYYSLGVPLFCLSEYSNLIL